MSQAISAADVAAQPPRRIPVGSEIYNGIAQFLYEEAFFLDEIRLDEWLECLAEDLEYSAPLRMTRSLKDQKASIQYGVKHFDETYRSIAGRILRLTKTGSAWAEDPPSRTRRLITNLLVRTTEKPDEFDTTNYLLLTRSRFEEPDMSVLSALRHDRVRRVGDGYKLVRREIILDQSVLGMPNLAIFL